MWSGRALRQIPSRPAAPYRCRHSRLDGACDGRSRAGFFPRVPIARHSARLPSRRNGGPARVASAAPPAGSAAPRNGIRHQLDPAGRRQRPSWRLTPGLDAEMFAKKLRKRADGTMRLDELREHLKDMDHAVPALQFDLDAGRTSPFSELDRIV